MAFMHPTFAKLLCLSRPSSTDFEVRLCLWKRRRRTRETRMAFEGLSDELRKIKDADMDAVENRRRAREAFKEIQLGIDHCLFKMPYHGLKMEEGYERNSRGVEIFSRSWVPETSPLKAVICYCHGYGDTCTFFFEGIARKLASSGYGVYAMDYPNFGLSEGLHGYVTSFDQLVDDVIEHFSKVKENPSHKSLPCFLFGQSMGGAVALKVHMKEPHAWDGAILLAPMCKIGDDMVPSMLVKKFLIGISKVLPKSKLIPEKDMAEMAFRELKKRNQAAYNIIAYNGKPRLKTGVELLKATNEIEKKMAVISLPLLILHGEADSVTDPSFSQALYEKANSLDKKLVLYPEAYHSLLEGEPDETILRVFEDIITWLDQHAAKLLRAS